MRSFWAIWWDQLDEVYVQVLLFFGLLTLVISIFASPGKDATEEEKSANSARYLESISIFFAVALATSIQTFCDWGKERQFLRLREEVLKQRVTVLRGQYGTTQDVLASQLVVGDVILLKAGDKVPADCLLIEEMDMKVDETAYGLTDDAIANAAVVKQCSYDDAAEDEKNPDPILLTDSTITAGFGKAVVLAVGSNTRREAELAETGQELTMSKQETPLMLKLEVLSKIISTIAYMILAICAVVFGLVWLLQVMFSDTPLVSGDSIFRLIGLAQTAVALLICCIPEGLPLVISMAMAFSVDFLKQDKLLIKNLDALETSGMITNVLCGKTSTLTTGDIVVGRLCMDGGSFNPESPEVNLALIKRLQNTVLLCSDVTMRMTENSYSPVGSPVEVGLIDMLMKQEVDVNELLVERERKYTLRLWIPFSSDRRRMTVAYQLPDEETVRVVVKGGPEYVVPMCSRQLDQNMDTPEFMGAAHDGEGYQEDVVRQLTSERLKPLTIAYKDMGLDDFLALYESNEKFETEETRANLENDLTLVATVGLVDELREEVTDAILRLNEASTNLRIVSGDHRDVVIQTAVELQMLGNETDTEFVHSSDELLENLKELMVEKEDEAEGRGLTFAFRDDACKARFSKELKQRIVAVYRATPELKHMLTAAFRISGSTVAVTGEGLSDARALSEASVGFAMGEDGCEAAKEHADVILTDDNFLSIVNAIRWGRNIQDNVRKFIQFQMTVNLSCLFIVILSCVTLTSSPFNIVQLLWINLIMDVLAAIAFSTENPHPTDIRKERIRPKDKLLTPLMWRAISSQALYQMIVMVIMLYAGPAMDGVKYNFYSTESTDIARIYHRTWMFQCFMMMNLFNMFNCRVLGSVPPEVTGGESAPEGKPLSDELNIFARIFSNWWFLIIVLVELNVQFFMVGYGGAIGSLFQTTPISFGMHLTAVLLGVGSWIIGAAVKKTPPAWLKIFPSLTEDASVVRDLERRRESYQQLMAVKGE